MFIASGIPSSRRVVVSFGAALLISMASSGCGDDEKDKGPDSPGGPSTSFTGFMTDGAQSGKIVVTVNSASLAGRPRAIGRSILGAPSQGATASGTFTFGGATTTVTGTYDDEADTLNMSGSGYAFRGDYDPGDNTPAIVGSFTGPTSSGFWAGIANLTAPRVYCGSWESAVDPDSGTFNFVAIDTAFAGTVVAAGDGEVTFFAGSVAGTGTTRDLLAVEGDPATFTLEIVGTVNLTTGATSGTYTYTAHDVAYGTNDNGTWSGALCP